MDQLVSCRRGHVEAYLLQSDAGYEVLDAIVQANINIETMSLEELRQLLTQFGFEHHRRKCR